MNDPTLEKREGALVLFEEYKELLTKSQQEIFSDYYLYDLSLSEIAENHEISKAAVSDSIHKSLTKLDEYESKLHVVAFKKEIQKGIDNNDMNHIKEVMENGI